MSVSSIRSTNNKSQFASVHIHNREPVKKSNLDTLKQIFTMRNLLLTVGTIGATNLFQKALNSVGSHGDHNASSGHGVKDLLFYALEIVFSISAWTILGKFVPHMKFNTGTGKNKKFIKLEPTDEFKKNEYKMWPTLKNGLTEVQGMGKFIALVTASYTAIQGATNYAKAQVSPDDKLSQNVLSAASFVAKLLAVFFADTWTNDKEVNLMAFIQSLTEACACCGNPRLACPQLAPVFTDLYNSATGQSLTSK